MEYSGKKWDKVVKNPKRILNRCGSETIYPLKERVLKGNLFRGSSPRALDPKGRLMLPPEFRDILLARSEGGKFMLTTYDGCLVGYPLPDWDVLEEQLNRLKTSSRLIRDFKRLVLGGAEELACDNQGRIRLGKSHLDYADISKNIVLVGQGNKFEIWDQTRFAEVISQNFDGLAEDLLESGVDLPI